MTPQEAFNDLSRALSKLGLAIVEHPGTGELSVISARDAERSSLEVVTTLGFKSLPNRKGPRTARCGQVISI